MALFGADLRNAVQWTRDATDEQRREGYKKPPRRMHSFPDRLPNGLADIAPMLPVPPAANAWATGREGPSRPQRRGLHMRKTEPDSDEEDGCDSKLPVKPPARKAVKGNMSDDMRRMKSTPVVLDEFSPMNNMRRMMSLPAHVISIHDMPPTAGEESGDESCMWATRSLRGPSAVSRETSPPSMNFEASPASPCRKAPSAPPGPKPDDADFTRRWRRLQAGLGDVSLFSPTEPRPPSNERHSSGSRIGGGLRLGEILRNASRSWIVAYPKDGQAVFGLEAKPLSSENLPAASAGLVAIAVRVPGEAHEVALECVRRFQQAYSGTLPIIFVSLEVIDAASPASRGRALGTQGSVLDAGADDVIFGAQTVATLLFDVKMCTIRWQRRVEELRRQQMQMLEKCKEEVAKALDEERSRGVLWQSVHTVREEIPLLDPSLVDIGRESRTMPFDKGNKPG